VVNSPAPDRNTIRVATFNVRGGKGRDGRRDLDRVADCLGGLDVVGLCEVHGSGVFAPENQAQLLAQRLDRAWLFAPASRRWYHSEFGNALLSDLPVRFWQRIPLEGWTKSGHRNVVLVTLECRDRPVHILIAHVTQRDSEERAHQLRAVTGLFLALEEPAVLLGDLNSPPSDPQIRQLTETPGVSDPVAQFIDPPQNDRVDWILVRGLRCRAAGVVDQDASDHPLFWAELELPR
jgi:endonuclease/exonuclease/phosphatase family metal-dependent hydrolase